MPSLSPFHSTLQLVWSDLLFDKASLMQDTKKILEFEDCASLSLGPQARTDGEKGSKHISHGFRLPKSSGSWLPSTRNWKPLKWLLQNDNVRKKYNRYKTLTANYRLQAHVRYKTRRIYWRQFCISCPHGVRSSLTAQVCCSLQIRQYTNWIISSTANHCWHLPHILFTITNPAT